MTTPLDHQALDSFYEDVGRDREFVIHIVALFRAQVEEFCREAIRGSDDAISEIAHKLAGSSGQLGLAEIVDAARRLESDLRAGTADGPELAFLQRELPGVVEHLDRWATGLPDQDGGQESGSSR